MNDLSSANPQNQMKALLGLIDSSSQGNNIDAHATQVIQDILAKTENHQLKKICYQTIKSFTTLNSPNKFSIIETVKSDIKKFLVDSEAAVSIEAELEKQQHSGSKSTSTTKKNKAQAEKNLQLDEDNVIFGLKCLITVIDPESFFEFFVSSLVIFERILNCKTPAISETCFEAVAVAAKFFFANEKTCFQEDIAKWFSNSAISLLNDSDPKRWVQGFELFDIFLGKYTANGNFFDKLSRIQIIWYLFAAQNYDLIFTKLKELEQQQRINGLRVLTKLSIYLAKRDLKTNSGEKEAQDSSNSKIKLMENIKEIFEPMLSMAYNNYSLETIRNALFIIEFAFNSNPQSARIRKSINLDSKRSSVENSEKGGWFPSGLHDSEIGSTSSHLSRQVSGIILTMEDPFVKVVFEKLISLLSKKEKHALNNQSIRSITETIVRLPSICFDDYFSLILLLLKNSWGIFPSDITEVQFVWISSFQFVLQNTFKQINSYFATLTEEIVEKLPKEFSQGASDATGTSLSEKTSSYSFDSSNSANNFFSQVDLEDPKQKPAFFAAMELIMKNFDARRVQQHQESKQHQQIQQNELLQQQQQLLSKETTKEPTQVVKKSFFGFGKASTPAKKPVTEKKDQISQPIPQIEQPQQQQESEPEDSMMIGTHAAVLAEESAKDPSLLDFEMLTMYFKQVLEPYLGSQKAEIEKKLSFAEQLSFVAVMIHLLDQYGSDILLSFARTDTDVSVSLLEQIHEMIFSVSRLINTIRNRLLSSNPKNSSFQKLESLEIIFYEFMCNKFQQDLEGSIINVLTSHLDDFKIPKRFSAEKNVQTIVLTSVFSILSKFLSLSRNPREFDNLLTRLSTYLTNLVEIAAIDFSDSQNNNFIPPDRLTTQTRLPYISPKLPFSKIDQEKIIFNFKTCLKCYLIIWERETVRRMEIFNFLKGLMNSPFFAGIKSSPMGLFGINNILLNEIRRSMRKITLTTSNSDSNFQMSPLLGSEMRIFYEDDDIQAQIDYIITKEKNELFYYTRKNKNLLFFYQDPSNPSFSNETPKNDTNSSSYFLNLNKNPEDSPSKSSISDSPTKNSSNFDENDFSYSSYFYFSEIFQNSNNNSFAFLSYSSAIDAPSGNASDHDPNSTSMKPLTMASDPIAVFANSNICKRQNLSNSANSASQVDQIVLDLSIKLQNTTNMTLFDVGIEIGLLDQSGACNMILDNSLSSSNNNNYNSSSFFGFYENIGTIEPQKTICFKRSFDLIEFFIPTITFNVRLRNKKQTLDTKTQLKSTFDPDSLSFTVLPFQVKISQLFVQPKQVFPFSDFSFIWDCSFSAIKKQLLLKIPKKKEIVDIDFLDNLFFGLINRYLVPVFYVSSSKDFKKIRNPFQLYYYAKTIFGDYVLIKILVSMASSTPPVATTPNSLISQQYVECKCDVQFRVFPSKSVLKCIADNDVFESSFQKMAEECSEFLELPLIS